MLCFFWLEKVVHAVMKKKNNRFIKMQAFF